MFFFFFGKWPWYKRENAFQGVHCQELMELAVQWMALASMLSIIPDNGHLKGHYLYVKGEINLLL